MNLIRFRPGASILGLGFVVAFVVGCESAAQERAKFDAWYPPGSTRDQIVVKFGQPTMSVGRPNDDPTFDGWTDAIRAKIPCLKPRHITYMVLDVEEVTGQRVQRLETYSPPDHITFMERLDFLYGAHVEAVYYNSEHR